MSEPEIFLECRYCTAKVVFKKDDPNLVTQEKCPQCGRNSLEVRSPYHFRGKFNAPIFVSKLLGQLPIITVKETQYVLSYNQEKGTYEKDTKIHAELNNRLGVLYKKGDLEEVLSVVRGITLIDQTLLNSTSNKINLIDGVFDLETYELTPHDPKYYFTVRYPFKYDPKAVPKKFLKFLSEICMGDVKDMITIIEGFAYSFIPRYPIQKAMMLVGSGANGKSTLISVLKAFIGEENCEHMTMQTLCKNGSFALSRLQGMVLNLGPDLPAQELIDSANFKALTGAETLSTDVKYIQDSVKLRSSAKQWFSANQIPAPPEDTIAYFRRWVILQFKNQFEEGNDILPELITDVELSGIFNLCLAVLPVLKANLKYTFSEDIETTREKYLKSADTVHLFADTYLTYDNSSEIPKSEVYEKYLEVCKAEGLIESKENAFWRSLKKLITYDEFRPVRGGPSFMRGQKLVKPEKVEKKVLTNAEVVELYKNQLHRVHKDNRDFSLLFISFLISVYGTTKREKPIEPCEPVAEVNTNRRIADEQISKIMEVFMSNPAGLALGPDFEHWLIDSERPLLRGMAQAGDLLQFKPGQWKLVKK